MYFPLNYQQINLFDGTANPSMVKNRNNATFGYWERSLFQRACSVLKFTLPDEWTGSVEDFFYYCLFRFGFVAVSKNAEHGLFFQPATLNGFNFYYQPTNALITNPALPRSLDLEIGKDCELIKLTPDYAGIWDVISYYAEKLSVLDGAVNMSLINSKFAYFMAAKNKAAAEAIKKMYDKMSKGEPLIVYDTKLLNDPTDKTEPWQFLERTSLKNSYITTDLLMDFQTILNNFDNEIGIPTVPYQKKERMVTDEATSKQAEAVSRVTVWKKTLDASIDACKKLYPELNISVELRIEEEKGDVEDGEDNTAGPV